MLLHTTPSVVRTPDIGIFDWQKLSYFLNSNIPEIDLSSNPVTLSESPSTKKLPLFPFDLFGRTDVAVQRFDIEFQRELFWHRKTIGCIYVETGRGYASCLEHAGALLTFNDFAQPYVISALRIHNPCSMTSLSTPFQVQFLQFNPDMRDAGNYDVGKDRSRICGLYVGRADLSDILPDNKLLRDK